MRMPYEVVSRMLESGGRWSLTLVLSSKSQAREFTSPIGEVMFKGRKDHLESLGELGLDHERFWQYDHSGRRAHLGKSGGEFFLHQLPLLNVPR